MNVLHKSSKYLEIIQKTNGGVPYDIQYEIDNKDIVKLIKKSISKSKEKKVFGAPVYIKYIFKGIKEGNTIIAFKYVNITNQLVSKEKKYYVFVDNKKNITIVNKTEVSLTDLCELVHRIYKK